MVSDQWGTADEIRFCVALGAHRPRGARGAARAALLRRYLAAARWRQHWGDINQAEVVRVVRDLIEEEGSGE